mgnify:CR=1 FL=1|jgi:hypothetical protein
MASKRRERLKEERASLFFCYSRFIEKRQSERALVSIAASVLCAYLEKESEGNRSSGAVGQLASPLRASVVGRRERMSSTRGFFRRIFFFVAPPRLTVRGSPPLLRGAYLSLVRPVSVPSSCIFDRCSLPASSFLHYLFL